jgi:hypothetical protein
MACISSHANSNLKKAVKDGPVRLPRYIEIRHSNGKSVNVNPPLTQPRARMKDINVIPDDGGVTYRRLEVLDEEEDEREEGDIVFKEGEDDTDHDEEDILSQGAEGEHGGSMGDGVSGGGVHGLGAGGGEGDGGGGGVTSRGDRQLEREDTIDRNTLSVPNQPLRFYSENPQNVDPSPPLPTDCRKKGKFVERYGDLPGPGSLWWSGPGCRVGDCA